MKVYHIENQNDNGWPVGGITTYITLIRKELNKKNLHCCLIGAGNVNKPDNTYFISISKRKSSNLRFFLKLFFSPLSIPDEADTICHFHHPYMVLPLALRNKKCRFVLTLHGKQDRSSFFSRNIITKPYYFLLNYFAFMFYDAIIADNEELGNYYQSRYSTVKEPLFVLMPPVDPDVFRPIKTSNREKFKLPEDKKVLLFAGRVEKVKNFDFLLKACKTYQEKYNSQSCLVVAGEGNYQKELILAAKKNNFSDLILLPFLEPHTLAELMNVSDILLITSFDEGGPITAIEAVACNLPVLALDVGEMKKFSSLFHCCHISEENEEYFAEMLNHIIRQGKSGICNRGIEQFSAAAFSSRLIEIYSGILQ